jgi:transposase
MGHIYKKKDAASLRSMKAVKACLEGKSIRRAAKESQVPLMILKHYLRKQQEQEVQISRTPTYNKVQVFSKEEVILT